MSGRTFTCGVCGGTFEAEESDWSEADAMAEFEAQFPGAPPEARRSACEDCYVRLMAWARSQGLVKGGTA